MFMQTNRMVHRHHVMWMVLISFLLGILASCAISWVAKAQCAPFDLNCMNLP